MKEFIERFTKLKHVFGNFLIEITHCRAQNLAQNHTNWNDGKKLMVLLLLEASYGLDYSVLYGDVLAQVLTFVLSPIDLVIEIIEMCSFVLLLLGPVLGV